MTKINHQNNFASNLATDTTAGATSSTLNDTPTVDAPFYLAFDATDVNGNYEVLRCITSPGLGVVTHAATANDHTTAEEVRMVVPALEMDLLYQAPEGTLINGRILPSVTSDNLTVALKTLAGADPSATDPVYVMIGGVMRSITSALSKTSNAGANYFNSGSAELATKEIDYFAYLLFKSSDSTVHIGYGRRPDFLIGSDYDFGTATVENHLEASGQGGVSDPIVNIGRFAATLSAGAGYTWSVPTFTATNLIQRPIYETRWLNAVSTLAGFSAIAANSLVYKIDDNIMFIKGATIGGTSNATTFTFTLPFANNSAYFLTTYIQDAGADTTDGQLTINASSTVNIYKTFFNGAFTNSGAKSAYFPMFTISI